MDSLIVHSLIVHELIKQPEERDAHLALSAATLPITDNSIELLARLEGIFERKADILQGFLATPEESLVPGHYDTWLQEGRGRAGFVSMTQKMMRVLQLSLTGVIGAKGGYLVFADYTIDERRMLAAFMIRNKSGLTFVKTGETMDIDVIQHLDVDNLAMSARIMAGDGRNVQLLRHNKNQGKISQYFMDWIGIQNAESSTELTWSFMEAVSELPIPTDKETGFAMVEADFDRSLIQFAAKSPQQTISASSFDAYFYGNETPLQDYINENPGLTINDDFRIDRRILRNQFYLKATHNKMTVHCTRDHLEQGLVHIDEAAGTVTIHNAELVGFLLAQDMRG